MNTEAKNHSEKGSILIPALVRLAWLVGPEFFAIRSLHHAPLACLMMCIGILWVWLSVDIGPFKAVQQADQAVAAKKTTPAIKFSFGRAVANTGFKLAVFALLFQSRLMGL